jgi:hypothetical protein
LAIFAIPFKGHNPFCYSIESVIPSDPHIQSWVEMGAPLTHQNVASLDELTAVALHSQPFGVRVASVASTACPFLMSHTDLLKLSIV